MLTSAFGLVLDERDAAARPDTPQLDRGDSQHRADDRAVARVHGRQTARAGAAQQPEQKRFGLIVARVAERHEVCVGSARARSKNPWRAVRAGVLDRPPLARARARYVLAVGEQTAGRARRARRRKLLVASAPHAELMVEVRQPTSGVRPRRRARAEDGRARPNPNRQTRRDDAGAGPSDRRRTVRGRG